MVGAVVVDPPTVKVSVQVPTVGAVVEGSTNGKGHEIQSKFKTTSVNNFIIGVSEFI
jgi:hypothetical protein